MSLNTRPRLASKEKRKGRDKERKGCKQLKRLEMELVNNDAVIDVWIKIWVNKNAAVSADDG